MFERVAEIITRYSMFQTGARVGVAVSGGADSVCLLHVLRQLATRWDLRLSVLHLNHRLRGEESDQDERFVREMAEGLGLPAVIRSWERRSGEPANLEEAARQARLTFFKEMMGTGEVDRVAVGHTRSDQAETVLFRFLRGAGSAGLAGIRPVTAAGIVRPLLCVGRVEVEAFLRERGTPWREDSTNRSPNFARNRIRHELLPLLARDWNPAIEQTLANTGDWAQGEEAYWKTELEELGGLQQGSQGGAILLRVDALRGLPVAAARRLVRKAMERAKGDLRAIDFRHIAAVLEMASTVEGRGRIQVPGLDIVRSFEWIRFGRLRAGLPEPRNYSFRVAAPGSVQIPGSASPIMLELIENHGAAETSDPIYNGAMGCIDWACVSGPLEVRNWRPGDQYQPIGSSGEQRIKTLFQEARVPLWERRSWPILADRGSILWARRFGPDARYAAGPGTRVALAVRDLGFPGELP